MAVAVAATSLATSMSSAVAAVWHRPCNSSIAPPHPYPSLAHRIHLVYQRQLIVIFLQFFTVSAACKIRAMAVAVAATSLATSMSSAVAAVWRRPCNFSIAPPHPYPSLACRIHLVYQRQLIIIFLQSLATAVAAKPLTTLSTWRSQWSFKAYWSVPHYLFPPSSFLFLSTYDTY
jgi:hypothetical protein